MKQMTTKLLERLRDIGLSQAEFARSIGESGQVVQNWKKRESIPNDKIAKVAKAIGVTTDWLLNQDDELPEQYMAKEASSVYGNFPLELARAWQVLDTSTREHLLAIAVALSKKDYRRE